MAKNLRASISKVLACSLLSLGAIPAIATAIRAESTPFTVIRANDSYFCRSKNQCTATIEAQNGDRYRIKYGGAIAINDGDRVLIEMQDQAWERISHPETGGSATVLGQTLLQ